jgi:HAD superfamily hydrolase (TIGR01509 family)
MTIKGLIFDFDGIILDTEEPEFQAWSEIYKAYNQTLSVESWKQYIGAGADSFDPLGNLETLAGISLGSDILTRKKQRAAELLIYKPMPGVESILSQAKARRLKLAVASSSDWAYVTHHLDKLGLQRFFDPILTCNDVDKVKPAPNLFNLALKRMQIKPEEAIVFEDSPNGILAANRAGIFCVAIPNKVTNLMDTSHADLHLESMAEMTLDLLIQTAERRMQTTNSINQPILK